MRSGSTDARAPGAITEARAPGAITEARAPGAMGDLAKDLRDASDSAILRVTGVIDRLEERGASDRLLEGLRPRLSVLRPPRPLNFSRALFMPMDAIIVPPGAWRPTHGTIPRTLIAPVAALVQERFTDAAALQRSLAAGKVPEPAFWRRAAEVLASSPVPDSWNLPEFQTRTGIRPQAMTALLAAIRLVFANAALFRCSVRGRAPEMPALRPLLLEAARSGPTSWSVVLTLLFEQTTEPASLVESIGAVAGETRLSAPLTEGLQRAVTAAVDKLDHDMPKAGPPGSLSDAALDAQALRAARLAGFSTLRGDMTPLARGLATRRQEMAAECRAQLAEGLKAAPLACVQQTGIQQTGTPSQPMTQDEQQEAAERLESRLQALRRLDLAARPLGDAQTHEKLLAQAAAAYCGADGPPWLDAGDRLRLCEILVGAEAALRLAGQQPPHA